MDAALVSRLGRAAFMHHGNKGHVILKHYATLKGLNNINRKKLKEDTCMHGLLLMILDTLKINYLNR